MRKSLIQDLLQARHIEFTPPILEVIDGACSEGLDRTDVEVGRRVLAKIDELKQPVFRGSQPLTPAEMAQRVKEALDYEETLHGMTDEQLREIYHENHRRRAELRRKKALQHDEWDFGHPKHDPDFEVWNCRTVWSVREALCLSLNKNPDTTDFEADYLPISSLQNEYKMRKNAIIALTNLSLDAQKPISFFRTWFMEHKMETPPLFSSAGDSAADSFSAIEALSAEIAKLRNEIDRLKNIKYRTIKMRAMIYCMAVDKYQYKRLIDYQRAVASIVNCTEKIAEIEGNKALSVSDNTVRKILKESAEIV